MVDGEGEDEGSWAIEFLLLYLNMPEEGEGGPGDEVRLPFPRG